MKEIIIESGESFLLGIKRNGLTVFKTIVIGNVVSYGSGQINGHVELIQRPPIINENFEFDDEDDNLDYKCPYCGITYDGIDYEFQICHHCKHHNIK